jgi:hypothetical protein
MVVMPGSRLLEGTDWRGDGAKRRGRRLFDGCLWPGANL